MTTTTPKLWTEAALLALPHDGCKYELVGRELHTMSPSGLDHSVVCATMGFLLLEFCRGKDLGVVMDGQAGFYMKNGDLFSPDVSFVNAARWKTLPREKRKKFFRGSPDLAVEVLSPSEPRRHIKRKVAAYLENDTRLVWVVDPVLRSVTVFAPGAEPRVLSVSQTLAAEPVLPGFAIPVASIFEDVDAD